MFVCCQCDLDELLVKQLDYLLSELKVLLVNFGWLGFSFKVKS
jgi:hypothetical protein